MEIVRKKLDPSEVYPTNLRYDSGCDCIQRTYDGGLTWINDPASDPRTSPAAAAPPPASSDPRCDAAASIIAEFRSELTATLIQISAGANDLGAASLLLTLLDFLDGIGLFIQFLIDLVDIIIGIGVTGIEAAFTDAAYQELECIIYCNIGLGTITAAQFAQIQAQVSASFGELSDVNLVFQGWLAPLGFAGLQTIAATKHIIGDCSACTDCPYDVELIGLDLQSQFLAANAGGAPTYQQGWWDETIPGWQAGIGTGGRSAWWQVATFTVPPNSTFTGYSMYFNPDGDNTDSVIKGLYATVNGTVVLNITGTTTVPNPWHADLPTPAVAGDVVVLVPNLNANSYRTDVPLYRVDIQGTGIPALTGIPA